MARDVKTIRIESVLGGESQLTLFGREDQCSVAVGINPFDFTDLADGSRPVGALIPSPASFLGTTASFPVWFVPEPKGDNIYVYDAVGSVYSFSNSNPTSLDSVGDLNDGGTASGAGAAYYDNYIYFARNTTIARYGPLNGTPAFTDDYWVSTLGLTALTNLLSSGPGGGTDIPPHPMLRHSDGRLYVADIVDNKGTLHYVQTSKTSVEGDTNDGSTYTVLQIGTGLHISCLETYGSDIAMGVIETTGGLPVSKIAFWDSSSTNINKITWVELPPGAVVSLVNANGVLYAKINETFTGNNRVLRFVGGYSFEEVFSSSGFDALSQQSMSSDGGKLLISGNRKLAAEEENPITAYSLDTANNALFGVLRASAPTGFSSDNLGAGPVLRMSTGYVVGMHDIGVDAAWGGICLSRLGSTTEFSNAPSVFVSKVYRIGQPFKVTKVRIPLLKPLSSEEGTMIITPKLLFDVPYSLSGNNVMTLKEINLADYGAIDYVTQKPSAATGNHSLQLELRWTGTAIAPVGLPITIEYELLDD